MKFMSIIFFFIFSLNCHSSIKTHWEKVETKQNVDIFRGKIENSPIVAFKGVSTIEAPIEKVLSVIYDVSRIQEWMSDIEEVKVLDKKSIFEKIEYNRTNAPWPVSDRDFVYMTKVNIIKEDNAVEVLVESTTHQDAPVVKDAIRGHLYSSRYYLKSLDGGTKTLIEVEMLADPKGSVPKWVVNLFQSKWPVSTVNGIRKIATEENYQVHPDLVETVAKYKF